MGYEAPLQLRDAQGARWVGVHAPQRGPLASLFETVLAAPEHFDDPDALEVSLREAGFAPARLGPRVWRVLTGDWASPLALKILPPRPRDRRRLGASLARRAHDRAHQLRAHGLAAPAPAGYLERARAARRGPSLTVAEFVEGPRLRAWWQDHLLPMRASDPVAFVREKRTCLRRLGALLRALHAREIFHGDLHAENLIVSADGLVVLDLESIRRGPGARRAVDKILARLARDGVEVGGLTRADRWRVLDAYLLGVADPGGRARALWRRVEARAARRSSEPIDSGTSAHPPTPV